MMFGRHPRLPIDAEFDLNEESYSEPSERDIEQAMENLVKIHKDITAKATVNISEAQKVQKDYYDRKHAPILMNKGAQVLIENTAQRERKGGGGNSAISGLALTSSTGTLEREYMNFKQLEAQY